MSTYVEMTFCELPETPYGFNKEKLFSNELDKLFHYFKEKFLFHLQYTNII